MTDRSRCEEQAVLASEGLRIEDVLDAEGMFVSTTVGSSMNPLLRHRKDTVVVMKRDRALRRYDVVLYRCRGGYVLHRIVDATAEGYVICGDNCTNLEREVADADIIGIATEFNRGGRRISAESAPYRLYAKLWVAAYPVRCMGKRVRARLARIRRSLAKESKA